MYKKIKNHRFISLILFISFAFTLQSCMYDAPRDNPNDYKNVGGGGSDYVPVTGITLNKDSTSILVGGTEQLTATITPANATNQNVTWKSSDDTKATVSSGGLVTGLFVGTAIVTVTTEDGGFSDECDVTVNWAAGNKVIYTADSISFTMAYVPGDTTFPTGTDDSGQATVTDAYWIGETEVTYELWYTVHAWAINNGYSFANPGREGHDGAITDPDGEPPTTAKDEPVTTINWRDAMVWCNAATEWYNANNGTSYTCVYTYSSVIIRDSQDSNATACDNAVAGSTATGFRLLMSDEWELAARWRNDATNTVDGYTDPYFTKGNSASGATADYSNATATQEVAWYVDNSGSSTHIVKTKTANALNLYDMNGNVWEWCFDWHPDYIGSDRVGRGSSWGSSASGLQVGNVSRTLPYVETSYVGFRLARTE